MLRIHQHLIRERITLIRSDGRNVIPILIHHHDDPHRGFLQTLLHLSAISRGFGFAACGREGYVEDPGLPYCFLVCFCDEPAFATFLFEELEDDLAPGGFAGGGGILLLGRLLLGMLLLVVVIVIAGDVELADEGVCALFDEGFDLWVGDVGECDVEDFVGCWMEGVEETVEENCVDDGFGGGGVSKLEKRRLLGT